MAKKTSKTAHVMNLLVKPEPEDASSVAVDTPANNQAPKDTPKPTKSGATANVEQEKQADAQLSQQMQNQLEAVLEQELAEAGLTGAQQSVQDYTEEELEADDMTVPEDDKELQEKTAEEPVFEAVFETDTNPDDFAEAELVAATKPVTEPEEEYHQLPNKERSGSAREFLVDFDDRLRADDDYICLNVMEEIVAGSLIDVMDRFALCKCAKCRADVTALTLNFLTPKYVGTYKGNLFVKIAAYEKQYSTDILSALTRACIHVKASPRH